MNMFLDGYRNIKDMREAKNQYNKKHDLELIYTNIIYMYGKIIITEHS